MIEAMRSLIKGKGIVEDPNSQKGPMHSKNDNEKRDHPCLLVLTPYHAQIPLSTRQPSNQGQNLQINLIDPVVVSDLDDPRK